VSIRSDFEIAFAFQAQYKDHLAEIAQKVTRVDVAGWLDDTRRNTDFLVIAMANDWRITARVRQADERYRYGAQFTIRLSRPSGAPTEMAKIKAGFGDFGIYGFASPDEPGRLCQWILYNIALLRCYLNDDGRWYQQRNIDGSSDFAAFDVDEVAGAQLGFLLNSEGGAFDAWPPPCGPCRVCGRPSWQNDEIGPMHPCCAQISFRLGGSCPACGESDRRQHTKWGWPS